MISYVNILRALAIIGVVIIHASGPLLTQTNNMDHWWIGNLFDGAVRWSVPIFIMISGMLLLNPKKEETLQTFLQKRASKIIIPFIFWVIFYAIWRSRDYLGSVSIPATIKDMINGNVYYHLWFMYLIVGLYLITPIIRVVIANCNRRLIEYYLIIWFITSSIFKIISYYTPINIGIELAYFSGYLGYFILGHYLHVIDVKKRIRSIIYGTGIIGLLFTLFGTYLGTVSKGKFEDIYYGYLSPNTVIVSIAIFILVKYIDWDKKFNRSGLFMRFMTTLSITSFGVYLIHPFIISLFHSITLKKLIGFNITNDLIHPAIGTPITIISILVVSLCAILILRKIPIVKKIVP